ncbi:hypothetical protein A3K55_01775 [Candidatus Shapirobacteria bacterium RBG_13_44_7]|uniref:Gas vesicle protein n=1 Tax=Candidatus Shapirobacteria bacterium RBG_13_44_7 TaxID=1802149 RepID=A0A1F7SFZ1_9BACT|nr:MAG: hypothetical protein A3K55_01775 [Candidatus Shapirobacteria bacterium RBG_13_44_7]
MSKNNGKFLLGGLLGAAAGIIGGILLAPKSGKETREEIAKLALEITKAVKTQVDETKSRVKDIFGKVSEEGTTKYKQVRDAVIAKVASVKTAGKEIDKDKYGKIVDEVLTDFKSDFEKSKSGLEKLAKYLKKDWAKISKALS